MDMIIPSLHGKRVLITGSSRGIGRALAEGFARCGANVAVHGSKPSQKMDETLEMLAPYGTKIAPVYGDLSDPATAGSIMEQTLAALGGIDILVCNASVQIRRKWYEIPLEEMQLLTQVNFFSAVQLIQLAYPHMRSSGWGRVITIGSVQQTKPHPDMLIYSALKSALRNVSQSLALQTAGENITVNNIAVGTIYTDRNSKVLENEQYYEKVKNDIPMKRIGDPEDCVGAVLMLCSDAGSYITGEDICVDGGKTQM